MGGGGDGRGGRVLLKIYNALPDEFIRLYYTHGHLQAYFQAALLHVHVQGLTGGGCLPPPLAILIVVTINLQLRLRNSHLLRFCVPMKKTQLFHLLRYNIMCTYMYARTHTLSCM